MAHGYLTPTDIRSDRNYLGAIAGAIGSRIKKSSNMAARERAYASKQAEAGGTSLEEAGIGRGYFFKRALGSSFGGDRIARTRGRFETDPGPGRDPSGTQASRFRGGFDYGVSNSIKSPTGGALANIVSPGGGGVGGGAAGFPGSGSTVINPDVLGGAMVQSQYRATTQNSNVSIDTTATEVKDLAGILNQIGQIIVSSSNSTIQAVDSVQQVNVQVVEGIKSLGQLQVRVAERQLDQQRQLAAAAEQNQMIMMSRLLSAQEARNFTEDDFSGNLTAEKGYGFGGKGGGFIGGLMNRLSDFFGMRMGPGGGGGGFRAPGGGGGAARGGGMLGGASRALGTNRGSMVNRMGGNFLARNATRMFGRGGLMPVLRPIFKRIPIFGGLIDFAVSLALGEPVGRAAAKAVGATLGAGLGSLIPVPGVGTIAGGILGDFAGGAIYDAITGSGENKETVPQLAGGARITGSKDGVLVRVGEGGVGKDELVKPLNKKVFEQEEQTRIDVQFRNRKKIAGVHSEGLKRYYDKENGWKNFVDAFIYGLGKIGDMLKGTPLGFLSGLLNRDPANNQPNTPNTTPYAGPISGQTFNPLAAPRREMGNRSKNQHYLAPRPDGREHAGIDITDAFSMGNTVAPVVAYKTGKITEISETGGGPGGRISIDHGGGFVSKYLHHVPRSDLKVGDTVYGGQKIADLLQYFDANGTEMTHLHFEMYKDGKNIDPTRYVQDAKNNISAPMTDAKAKQEHEKLVPPHTPPPTPQTTPQTTGSNAQQRLQSLEAESNSIRKMRAALTPDALTKAGAGLLAANKAGRSSKPNEDVVIPGVGRMRYFDNGIIKKFTYFNLNGNEIDEKSFLQLIEKRDSELENKQKELLEKIGTTREELQVSSASTNPDVLRTSAQTDAADRAAKTQVAFLNTPVPQKQQGGSSDSSAILAALGSASSSPRSWTPAGFHNAILEA